MLFVKANSMIIKYDLFHYLFSIIFTNTITKLTNDNKMLLVSLFFVLWLLYVMNRHIHLVDRHNKGSHSLV